MAKKTIHSFHDTHLVIQIDLCPQLEEGKWVVRKEVQTGEDSWELFKVEFFNTKKEANRYIKHFIEKHS